MTQCCEQFTMYNSKVLQQLYLVLHKSCFTLITISTLSSSGPCVICSLRFATADRSKLRVALKTKDVSLQGKVVVSFLTFLSVSVHVTWQKQKKIWNNTFTNTERRKSHISGSEIALSWSPIRLKILHWRPEFHSWLPTFSHLATEKKVSRQLAPA